MVTQVAKASGYLTAFKVVALLYMAAVLMQAVTAGQLIDPRVRRPDTTLATERLGWQARVPAREGLRRTIEWFMAELTDHRRLTTPAPA